MYGSSSSLHLWKWNSLKRTRWSLQVKLTKLKIFSIFFSQKFLLPPPDFKTSFSLLPNVNFNHIFWEPIKKNPGFTKNIGNRKYLMVFAHKNKDFPPLSQLHFTQFKFLEFLLYSSLFLLPICRDPSQEHCQYWDNDNFATALFLMKESSPSLVACKHYLN